VKNIKKEVHKKYMNIALKLAEKARGNTSPNPLVGAVLVKNDEIIGKGYHKKRGSNHAEVEALHSCNVSLKGDTMYVTLEPCCFYGHTPPCTQAILKSGITKVIVGMIDPNPNVNGKGIRELEEGGVDVEVGFLQDEISRQNEIYIKHITKKIPFIALKMAISVDGKMCTKTKDSKWITSDISRKYVHGIRSQFDSILTGVGTVLADDPLLTARYDNNKKNPIRIVVDSRLKIPLDSKLLKTANETKLIIATTKHYDKKKAKEINKLGAEILIVDENKNENIELKNRVNLNELLKILGEKEITSVLIEAGPTLSTSFIKQDLVDKFHIFIAPMIIGGYNAFQTIGDLEIVRMVDTKKLNFSKVERIGDDLLIEAYPI